MPDRGSEHAPAMWSIDEDRVCKNRTWWWWWWLLFLDDPADPEGPPRQFCSFWGTRNCPRARIHGTHWERAYPVRQRDDGVDFHGMSCAWYYNGQEMFDPLYLEPVEMSIQRKGPWGSLTVKDKEIGFSGTPVDYELKIIDGDFDLQAQLTPWTDALSNITPTGQDYKGNLGYRMFKIRGAKVAGTLKHRGEAEQISGTAYFQRVRISSPTTPWFWGIFQSERGDFIDYFMPYLSPELLRRRPSERSFLGRPRRALSATIGFLDGSTGEHYDFTMKVRKGWNQQGRPNFHLTGNGRLETEGSIDIKIQTYQRATWRVQQPWLGISSTVLHYNEYPAELVDFRLETPDGILERKELGRVVGNVEHAWGVV